MSSSLPSPFLLLSGILFSFLLGSIPFGFLIGKAKGIDIRELGSKNIGATNVGRILGWKWALVVFILDFFKGLLPVFIVVHWRFGLSPTSLDLFALLCGLFSILGHNFTPWLKGRGGKGIATSAGVLSALMPKVFVFLVVVWVALFFLTHIVSISSICVALLFPLFTFLLYPESPLFFFFSIAASCLALWRHRSNIKRILAGTEPKLKFSKQKTK
ncbi:glycerol-3-phosphate 1-O-acyltransferase PlsY [Candidatus Methylacidiphilum infernorum]|uniref:Glycerol-3-phosphate acyltransferase n=1 Tax=Candidatus Methylacidiphilum infernorum TaxID=511746 RepID=A0ABX7PT41_9BACT|nr:glycerol-3-phosphate 1-O-acyltransferase PlsY [Candidatus Methylacidiphilum infernorum]QSR86136.1 glycerol-3-phosphate 1-O-acyltransferase PlsY [Candidatus Methylacidiphilum infernorum]